MKPEDLILSKCCFPLRGPPYQRSLNETVTRVGIDLRFRLRGPFKPNVPHHPSFLQRPSPPTVLYLATSFHKDQVPLWSQSPVFDLKAPPPHYVAGCTITTEA